MLKNLLSRTANMKTSTFNKLLLGAGLALGLALTEAALMRSGQSQPTIGGPFATSTVVGTSSTQIIPPNPSRRSITICNGAGATNAAAIAPIGITPVLGATGTGVQLATGGCFTPPTLTNSGTSGGVTAGWNGIGAASGQSIIVLEW